MVSVLQIEYINVDTLSHTVNRLFLSREKLTSNGVLGLYQLLNFHGYEKQTI